MNILITGSNGFLGKELSSAFKKDNNVYGLSRSNAELTSDLSLEIPKVPAVDMVIHCAGKAHSVPKSEAQKQEFHAVNVIGTFNLLKGLNNVGLPKEFVFISSVAVYGRECGTGINEDYTLDATDPYGRSKIEAELIVRDWCEKYRVICTIIRLPLLVGKNPPGNLKAMMSAIKKGYYFNIAGGQARKSMILTSDVASFIKIASPFGGIYNLTDGIHPSFEELSFAIGKRKQKNLPFYLARALGFIGDLCGQKSPITTSKVEKLTSTLIFDDSKARKLSSWKPHTVLEYLQRESI